jgi:hypothetical protein
VEQFIGHGLELPCKVDREDGSSTQDFILTHNKRRNCSCSVYLEIALLSMGFCDSVHMQELELDIAQIKNGGDGARIRIKVIPV